MVLVRCPIGCGALRRPFILRAEAVRCTNCTAWFAAAPEVEDGALVDGILVAAPGLEPGRVQGHPEIRHERPVRRLLRFALRACAIAYPLAVAGVVAALALVGEKWWPTTVALYVPRVVFAAPLPFLALALLAWGPRWLLAGQALAAALVVFPLMGLELGGGDPPPSKYRLRILSYNVDYGHVSLPEIHAEIAGAAADVILLQASDYRVTESLKDLLAGLHTRRSGEFFVASKFPILDFYEPPPLSRTVAGFVRATLDSPLGPLDVYDAHPRSPRRGLEVIHNEVSSEGGVSNEGPYELERNAGTRGAQVAALAAHARNARNPVVIAGDTNLPGLSPLFRENLGEYQDGFAEIGRGFGYTFPAHKWLPWMRIDRVLAGSELRFLEFRVGERRGSDHFCVIADVAAR